MSYLSISGVTKQFGETVVVDNFNLDIEKGEFVSFLGPSGCGKTTTLRMVAGFETPTSGKILLDGADITDKAPNQRNVGMIFQSYALFPNMTVAQNIGFGLRVRKEAEETIKQRVEEMIGLINLEKHANKYPYQLSGGQQQRVAIARAIVNEPSILLADEPTGALDSKTGVEIMDLFQRLHRENGQTVILVTHDSYVARHTERIIKISDGRIVSDEVNPNPIKAGTGRGEE